MICQKRENSNSPLRDIVKKESGRSTNKVLVALGLEIPGQKKHILNDMRYSDSGITQSRGRLATSRVKWWVNAIRADAGIMLLYIQLALIRQGIFSAAAEALFSIFLGFAARPFEAVFKWRREQERIRSRYTKKQPDQNKVCWVFVNCASIISG